MSQPPDDPLYRASNEHANDPAQQRADQAPGSARPASASNYPGRQDPSPNYGPMSQPGFPQQSYQPEQGSRGQSGFPPQSYQPGSLLQEYQANQRSGGQQGFAGQGSPQQRSAPVYAGQQSAQTAGPASLPGPGTLPKHYNFPTTGRDNAVGQGVSVHDLPTSRLNPTSTPPAKKRLRVGRLLALVLVLVLLVGGGVGAVVFLRHSNVKPKTTVHATATATSTPADGGVGSVGQPLQAGANWVMTVTSVHASTSSDYAPKKGDTYLEISLTLKNVSPNTQFVSSMIEFTLADSGGGQYSESVNDTYTRQAVDGHLTMNQALNGQVAYEIPQSQHHFVLTFHYGLPDGSSDSASWNISI